MKFYMNVVKIVHDTYCCLNKLWAPTSDQLYALKHIDDLDDFNSIHKIRNGDIGT